MYICVYICLLYCNLNIQMAAIKHFDIKSKKNRERVRKCRQKKMLMLIYENNVEKLMNAMKNKTENSKAEPNVCDEPDIDHNEIFTNKLKNWAVKNRISAMAINELLKILIFAGFNFLPRVSRTMMGTPKQLAIQTLSHGRMWYNGIKTCLENIDLGSNISILTLNWNFDGLPVFKSSNLQFWPILASIKGRGKYGIFYSTFLILQCIQSQFYLKKNYFHGHYAPKTKLWSTPPFTIKK